MLAVHLHLLEHGEGHPVGGRTEGGDLLGGPGLLLAELVAGESEDGEALVTVGLLQSLQSLVLGGEPALGGHVDHQQRLAAIVADRGRIAVQGVEGRVVDAHGVQCRGPGHRRAGQTSAAGRGRPAVVGRQAARPATDRTSERSRIPAQWTKIGGRWSAGSRRGIRAEG